MNRLPMATAFTLATLPVFAQGTLADYQRAATLRETWPKLATGVPEPAVRTAGNKFVYRRSVAGGATGTRQPAEFVGPGPA
ncbi:MAG TPA: hypothetical protein VNH18_11935 [Bryobacteraceae bacterium]|nr:hypothetical protein [Bryobacteraceae bacterium]